MNILKNILEKINTFSHKLKIIFPEGNSERIQTVAKQLIDTNISQFLFLQHEQKFLQQLMNYKAKFLLPKSKMKQN